MKIELTECLPKDLKILVDISKTTFKAAFEMDNNPEDFQYYLNSAFSLSKLKEELDNPNTQFYFIHVDNTLAGYLKMNQNTAQSELQDSKALELERIYVLKAFQGKRIGSWAIDQVISMAKNRDKEYVWLGVWEQNPEAIKFYKRLGFEKFGEHPYYIGKDKQTDWLMRYDLN